MCGKKPEKVGGPTLYRDKMAENSASWFGGVCVLTVLELYVEFKEI
jgi:hypothetical protein